MNFQMMIINSAAVVEDKPNPYRSPKGEERKSGRRSLCPPSLRIDPDDSKSPPFEKPWLPHPPVFASPVLSPFFGWGSRGNLKKTDSPFVL
jgi:hypothetical protein